jgi:hypothetical protein
MTSSCGTQEDRSVKVEALTDQLVALFEGQELEVVKQATEEATRRAFPDAPLRELFRAQMETLRQRGCPEEIVEALVKQEPEVIARASEMEVAAGNIPFVAVVPRTIVDANALTAMVVHDGKKGVNYLEQSAISNVVEVPDQPYFIYNVEDGQAMFGKSPKTAEGLIKEQGRSCLTVDEVLALCIQTDVLSRHYVDAAGSRYLHAFRVPFLSLRGGEPRLRWDFSGIAYVKWGSASCRSRS